jgi:hypothetical protein
MNPLVIRRAPHALTGAPSGRRLGTAALLLAAFAAAGPETVACQEDPWAVTAEQVARAQNAPLFQSSDVLEITLAAEFDQIKKKDRGEEVDDREATISFAGADGQEITLPLKLRTRGNFRLSRQNCAFPPLWLDFDKDLPELEGTVFEGQNRLKLYVSCRPGRDNYEQFILQEYLVYPTYNLLTDASFRARPVLVHYQDTEKPDDSFTRHAFILEHKSQMAARIEAVPFDANQVHPGLQEPSATALMEVFNYMIGMTDWSAVYLHNVEMTRRTDGKLIPVSYDFDWSGLVNTSYAEPDESLDIRSVRQRIFQGFCREIDYGPIFQRFLDKKEEILALWSDFELVEEDRREDAVDFLEGFFESIDEPGKQERLLRGCRDMPG